MIDGLRFAGVVRIPLCGTVALTETEMAIVETADFQRLRGVRQLGTVVWAYPAALHTRLEHSLGTLAKADEMLSAVARAGGRRGDERGISIEDRKLTRVYALLHDVTHVPFGHTIEDEFGLFGRHGKNPVRTERFLGPRSEIGSLLRRMEPVGFYDRLMAIYLWEGDERKRSEREGRAWAPLRPWLDMAEDDAFVQDIVSNGVCADLLDYSVRDAHYCGVEVAEFGLTESIHLKPAGVQEGVVAKRRVFVGVEAEERGRPQPGVLRKLASLMEVGDVLSQRVYGHHETLAASAMLARAVQEFDALWDDESYLYGESDDSLVAKICDWEKELGRSGVAESPMGLATLLRDRTLHRKIAAYDVVGFAGEGSVCRDRLSETRAAEQLGDPSTRRDVENGLAAEIGRRPGAVLIYPPVGTRSSKAMRARVEWRCMDTTLAEVGDPAVASRLSRWRRAGDGMVPIRLFGSREMRGEDVRAVTRAFEEWMVSWAARGPRRLPR